MLTYYEALIYMITLTHMTDVNVFLFTYNLKDHLDQLDPEEKQVYLDQPGQLDPSDVGDHEDHVAPLALLEKLDHLAHLDHAEKE